MEKTEIERMQARNAMLESDNRILASDKKKLKEEIKKLEKIIKEQDLEIQRLTNGNQQELF